MTSENGRILPDKSPRLGYHVWKLLRLRWLLFLRGFLRSKVKQRVGVIVLAIFILGLMAGAFTISWLILGFLKSPKLTSLLGDTTPFLEAVPTLVLLAAFGGILITSFGVLLQALYLANDMEFLLSTPVPIRAVFIAKILQAVLPNLGLTLLFGLPVLLGLGASQKYTIIYYPVVVFVLTLLSFSAAALASLIVMGIVRLFPARRVAEVLAFIGAILSFICGQSGQLFRFHTNTDQTVGALNSLARINHPWFPIAWGGRSLVEIGLGNWTSGIISLFIVVSIAVLIVIFALITAERLYYTGWATAQISPRKKKAPKGLFAPTGVNIFSFLWSEHLVSSPVRAIVVKDLLVLRRDLRNLSQLITPLIFGVLYSFILFRDTGDSSSGNPGEQMTALVNFGNTGIAILVGWMLLMRLALIAFSQEGKNYWLLKTSPINPQRLLAAKFLVAFLPASLLGCSFLMVTSLIRGTDFITVVYGLNVISFCFAGMSGMMLAFGVLGADFEWTDPRQMIRGNSGCIGNLVGMVYIVLCGGLFMGPVVFAQALNLPVIAGGLAGLTLGVVFSLTCAYIPLQLVLKKVEHLGDR